MIVGVANSWNNNHLKNQNGRQSENTTGTIRILHTDSSLCTYINAHTLSFVLSRRCKHGFVVRSCFQTSLSRHYGAEIRTVRRRDGEALRFRLVPEGEKWRQINESTFNHRHTDRNLNQGLLVHAYIGRFLCVFSNYMHKWCSQHVWANTTSCPSWDSWPGYRLYCSLGDWSEQVTFIWSMK